MAEQTLKEKTAKGLFWGGLSNGVQQVLNLVFGLMLALSLIHICKQYHLALFSVYILQK